MPYSFIFRKKKITVTDVKVYTSALIYLLRDPDKIFKIKHIINFIKRHPEQIHIKNIKDGDDALMIACRYLSIHATILQELINCGGNVNTINKYGLSALLIICSNGHNLAFQNQKEKAEILINSGADVNFCNITKITPLHWLCTYNIYVNNIDIIKVIIDKGADVNKQNSIQQTPLHIISTTYNNTKEKDRANIIEMLINAGSNVNIQDKDGDTPLMKFYAAVQRPSKEKTNLAKLFLNANTNMNLLNSYAENGLIFMCKYTENTDNEIIKYCFDKPEYCTEENIMKCLKLGRHQKMLLKYLELLYYRKLGFTSGIHLAN